MSQILEPLQPDPTAPHLYRAPYASELKPLTVVDATIQTFPLPPGAGAHWFSLRVPRNFEEGDIVTVDATAYRDFVTGLLGGTPSLSALFHNQNVTVSLTHGVPWRQLGGFVFP